jgi:protein-ribulosamine 3-kinase
MEEIDMKGPISIKEILAQLDGVFPMDEAVIEGDDLLITTQLPRHALTSTVALPHGTTFLSVENFGTSAWTVTGRVMALEPDGTEQPYFLKVRDTAPFPKMKAIMLIRPACRLRMVSTVASC